MWGGLLQLLEQYRVVPSGPIAQPSGRADALFESPRPNMAKKAGRVTAATPMQTATSAPAASIQTTRAGAKRHLMLTYPFA